jgi:hypothetical protein
LYDALFCLTTQLGGQTSCFLVFLIWLGRYLDSGKKELLAEKDFSLNPDDD